MGNLAGRWLGFLCAALCGGQVAVVVAQTGAPPQPPASTLKLETGKQIWEAGCVACHGARGEGQSDNLRGFEAPDTFPDFSDCPTSTVEADIQWRAIITNGGKARAFSEIMPSFKDLLTREQIDKVIEHIRGFCTEDVWPRGNLNLPRAMITEKAFPENETVVAGSVNAQGAAGIGSTVFYEKRIGATAMWEVAIPYDFTHESGSWGSALGNLALGYKQKVAASLKRGSIVSLGGEIQVPTGNTAFGTGGESTVFEGFAAYGQILPARGFLQVHTGIELPAHPDKLARAYYLRTAIGKTFSTDRGLGRNWSPMMELVADRDLESGATTNWDVVPQVQIPLNKRMHVLASIGFRIPVNNTADRPRQVMFYGLWDWADGGLLQGW